MADHKDTLYASSQPLVNAFQFDQNVARVFADMIQRSVPGYPMMLETLSLLAKTYVQDNSHCYDLGCSLGASTLAIRQGINARNINIVAVDSSPAMIEHFKAVVSNNPSETPIDIICANIMDITLTNCNLVSMNLTLQFIPIEQRASLLRRIANSLVDDGVLFLSEKIAFDSELENNRQVNLHHQFKKQQGYSELEIAQKRTAIDNVLIPETLEAHKERLLTAGFKQVSIIFQCFNFVSMVAYK